MVAAVKFSNAIVHVSSERIQKSKDDNNNNNKSQIVWIQLSTCLSCFHSGVGEGEEEEEGTKYITPAWGSEEMTALGGNSSPILHLLSLQCIL